MKTRRYLPGKILLLLMAAAMLGGCTKEESGGGEPLPEGKYPIEFTSTAYRLDVKTRATTDNKWDGGEEVAIRIGDVTKKYVADQNGNLTAATGVPPFCWTSTDETTIVTAWCPYSSSLPKDFSTKIDQSIKDGYLKSDFIVACKEIRFSDAPKELTFQHLTAQVTINITGNNIPDLSSATVTLTNAASGISKINVTPGSITTGVSTSNGTKTPKVVSVAADKIVVQALLPPSKVGYGSPPSTFVKVELSDKTYIYTPIEEYLLSAGMSYTFNITVQGEPQPQIGDYYYDNKTYSTTYDTQNGARTCIGIVFAVNTDGKTGRSWGCKRAKVVGEPHLLMKQQM